MKLIPYFSVPELNRLEEYRRFSHCSAYLQAKSAQVKDRRSNLDQVRDLMRASGYAKLDKFRAHRREWDQLRRNVPKGYLEFLGVDYRMLSYFASLDMRAFEHAKQLTAYPKVAIVRIIAGIYNSIHFKEGTTEEEALEKMKHFAVLRGLRCAINYPGFKTIWIETDGRHREEFYPPRLSFSKKFLKVGYHGRGIGTTRIA